MPSTYKNNTNRAILGIQPGETGELEDAAGFVGPEALEVVEEKAAESRYDEFAAKNQEHHERVKTTIGRMRPDADSD